MSEAEAMGSRRPIAVGRTAEIYPWGEGRVMKLYRPGSSRAYVSREAQVSRVARQLGLPAPAVYDSQAEDGVWEIDGRLGILFDRIDGSPMLRDLVARPWRTARHAATLGRLHARIHTACGDGLPDLRAKIERAIETASGLPESLRASARDALTRLPRGACVCHGDFHPDNVLLASRGSMIVDWGPASCGPPPADVAWTYLLFTVAGAPVGASTATKLLLLALRRLALRIYLRTYFKRTGLAWRDVEQWLGVISILRLGDGIPEERDALLALVRRHLGEPA